MTGNAGRSKKESILITAGPTRERIDPVRFISNYSTGTFGYAIAVEAARRGMDVTLISGPTAIKAPAGVKFIGVESAREMCKEALTAAKKAKYIIMAAAVSDWRPRKEYSHKIKRTNGIGSIELIENQDILRTLGRQKKGILAGFALETDDLVRNAKSKLKAKNMDFIVANKLNAKCNIFGDNKTDILIIDRDGGIQKVLGRSKRELAKIILDKALSFNI